MMLQDSKNKQEEMDIYSNSLKDIQEVSGPAPMPGLRSGPVPPYPGFWQAVLLLVIFLFFQILFLLPFVIAGLSVNPATLTIPSLLSAIIVIAYGFKRTRASFRHVFPFQRAGTFLLLALFLTIVGLNIVLREIVVLLVQAIPPSGNFLKLMEDTVGGRQNLWGSFLLVAIVAPLTEEMIFRGLVLYGFLKRYSFRKAILGSAILFALMHGNPWQFVTATCLGIFLAWCFVKTHSLVPCLFGHCINNIFGFVPIFLQVQFDASPIRTIYANLLYRLGWDALGVILAVSGLYMLKRFFSRANVPSVQAPLVSASAGAG